jgi:hypothetical protein
MAESPTSSNGESQQGKQIHFKFCREWYVQCQILHLVQYRIGHDETVSLLASAKDRATILFRALAQRVSLL